MVLDPEIIDKQVKKYLSVLLNKQGSFIRINSATHKHGDRSITYQRIKETLDLMNIHYRELPKWKIMILKKRD